MPGIEPKKASLLRTLDILREYSDAEHWLEQGDIADILNEEYGIELERKAISRNIDTLIEMGYDIEKTRRGCFLASREFEDSELRLLIDSVLSSRQISPKQSKALIEKLKGLSSKYFIPRVRHVHTLDEWNKNENPALFYNIDIIDEAIEKKRKIRFTMNIYGVDKKLHPNHEHIVSPMRLIMKNQCYRLLCVERYKEDDPNGKLTVKAFPIDRITNMEITHKRIDKHDISNASYEELLREHPYMEAFFDHKAEYITFVCHEASIGSALEVFGKNIRIEKMPSVDLDADKLGIIGALRVNLLDAFVKITVKTNRAAVRRFVYKNLPLATILSPKDLRDEIEFKTSAEIMKKEYARRQEFMAMVEKSLQKK